MEKFGVFLYAYRLFFTGLL